MVKKQRSTNEEGRIVHVDRGRVVRKADRKRQYNPDKLAELQASVAAVGILQPLLVRERTEQSGARVVPSGKFELISGDRRLTVAERLNLRTVPCFVRYMDDKAAETAVLHENLEREDYTPMEEAAAIARMRETGLTADEIATHVGRSRRWVMRRACLRNLSTKWQAAIAKATGPEGMDFLALWGADMLELVARFPAAQQDAMLVRLQDNAFYMPETPDELRRFQTTLTRSLDNAPWPLNQLIGKEDDRACDNCGERSDKEGDLFDAADLDVWTLGAKKKGKEPAPRCLNGECWRRKMIAHFMPIAQAAAKRYKNVHLADPVAAFGSAADAAGTFGYPAIDAGALGFFEKAKRGDKDATPILFVSGGGAGRVRFMVDRRGRTPGGGGRGAGQRARALTLPERRERLSKRRRVAFATQVIAILDRLELGRNDPEIPKLDVMIAIAQCFTVQPHEFNPTPWEHLAELIDPDNKYRPSDYLFELEAQTRAALVDELTRAMKYRALDGVPLEPILDAYGIDYKGALEAIERDLPEPKSWANLNEDGTKKKREPKKAKPPKPKPGIETGAALAGLAAGLAGRKPKREGPKEPRGVISYVLPPERLTAPAKPNKHGVFDDADAATLRFQAHGVEAYIQIVSVSVTKHVVGYGWSIGSMATSAPPSENRESSVFNTIEKAIEQGAACMHNGNETLPGTTDRINKAREKIQEWSRKLAELYCGKKDSALRAQVREWLKTRRESAKAAKAHK